MKYPIAFAQHLLLERLNAGGMAEVFKAKALGAEGFERLVALKRILPSLAEDSAFTTMFVDEAQIVSRLIHQNIVQIYDFGEWDGLYYISMEYVAGRDMHQILEVYKELKLPLEVEKACFIVSCICEALEYAHRRKDHQGRDMKIIHRDVSPQNILISFEGEVKLCDFGIAKSSSRLSRTQVGVLKGKCAYMSPEQVSGRATDHRSDLFALGVIFYEMLTSERLFARESEFSTLEAVQSGKVRPPSHHNSSISSDLEDIMLKLLARDPDHRYQWASELQRDLRNLMDQQGRSYQSRELRSWMQQFYAQEIQLEQAPQVLGKK